ncbi:MAG: DUF4118 domain-containing protein [Alphaproteobacteria bacterium]
MPIIEDSRPNPDSLLALVKKQSEEKQRGKLKIFFGSSAGVGKTYSMLKSAYEKLQEGVDVVVGIAETHDRPETKKLLDILPKLPLLEIDHKNIKIKEFDLEGALKRKPELILVDELAHTNAPNLRHAKRWSDIEDLLRAGIDVYTCLNVQHLESVNDVVKSITGIKVLETVPDSFFDQADEIVLIDIPSEELLFRLKEGKVYVANIAKNRAAENFFRKENLIALREMALRRTAERVDAQKDVYSSYLQKQGKTISDKLLVCIGAGDLSPKLLRVTKQLSNSLKCPWKSVYLENARHYNLDEDGLKRLERNFRIAEQLGANTEIIKGASASQAILDYAKKHGVTKIVVGKPVKSKFYDILTTSLVDDLIRESGEIDIYVVTGKEYETKFKYREKISSAFKINGYVLGAISVTIATALGYFFKGFLDATNLIMLYVLSCIFVASRFGKDASIFTVVLGIIFYNFFFTKPYYNLSVFDKDDAINLAILCLTSVIVGSQTSKLLTQSNFFRKKEKNTSALYSMSKDLTIIRGKENISEAIRKHLEQIFDGIISVWLPDDENVLKVMEPKDLKYTSIEHGASSWAFEHKEPAGFGTQTLPSARGYYIPITSSSGIIGVLGFIPKEIYKMLTMEEKDILENFAILSANAYERAKVADISERSKVSIESEKLRNMLIASISNDLKTPLASIKKTITLLDNNKAKDSKVLLNSAKKEVSRLEKIISNLINLGKIESGSLELKKDLFHIEKLLRSAIDATEDIITPRKIHVKIKNNLPPINIDGLLIEEVFINLIENVAKHTDENTELTISATIKEEALEIAFEDDGFGIPKGFEDKIFDKLSNKSQFSKDSGFSLSICSGIIASHKGSIKAFNNKLGGASFVISLPVDKEIS